VGAFLAKHCQTIVNIALFLLIAAGVVYGVIEALKKGTFGMVEGAFYTSALILMAIILVRWKHTAMSKNLLWQAVAICAFFTVPMFDPTRTASPGMLLAARIVAFISVLWTIATLLNLGRSFGILIALRKVKTGGLYSIIRHPMYLSDITFRLSFVLANPSIRNTIIFVSATACYVTRALLEERFLSQDEEYREYRKRVRYRFIPWVF
jgi:protein-S-isoprenylcysteine O-methyltransferase Ste14